MKRTKMSESISKADNRTGKSSEAPAGNGYNDIARRAYDRYLARGREHGHDVEDWLQAERESQGDTV